MRSILSFLLTCCVGLTYAQQFTLGWASATTNGVSRVKYAANGDLFAVSSGNDNVKLQRFNGSGELLWTKTLSAPSINALDMDVDGNDNVFLYLGFTTGQLDLDPGPLTTLVDPGKVYAKYSSTGAFQWGFSLQNSTDLSASYGGLSCDDAGNLYIAGNLGMGTYDMDPGPGVSNIVVETSSGGVFIARYRPDGTLHWANVRHWVNGFNYTRAIAAMRNGAGFFVVQRLDDGGPLSNTIDVDPGPGVYTVSNESMNLLRYDSTFAFVARAGINFGEQRLAADNAGSAYMLATAYSGGGQWALKYSTSGQSLNQVYQTSLPGTGNIRVADIVADGQGGSLGAYSSNCTANYYRFFKMNVSGLVDHNFTLYSGSDCTYPIVRGFAARGPAFAIGSFNQGYAVDFDPGTPVVSLPTGTDRGAVAVYNWCSGSPYEPFGIDVLSSAWCVGDTLELAVDAFGDAAAYTWDAGAWEVAEGQGGAVAQVVASAAGPATISVRATNDCGSSAPVSVALSAGQVSIDLPNDTLACVHLTTVLDPGPCADCTYLWTPGGATSTTLPVDITETTTFTVTVAQGACVATDSVTITIDVCAGLAEVGTVGLQVSPVPAVRGQAVQVTGLAPASMLRLTTVDGRTVLPAFRVTGERTWIATDALTPGVYLLHGAAPHAVRLVIQ